MNAARKRKKQKRFVYLRDVEKPLAALITATVGVSFAAVRIKSVPGVPPLAIAFYRLLFTTLILAPAALGHTPHRAELATLGRRQWTFLAVIGVVLAAHFTLWITSLTKTTVASSVILVTSHPVMVAPLAFYFLKERVSTVNVAGIGISLAGVVILMGGNYGLDASSLEGNVLALLGGVAAGFYILGGKKLRVTVSAVAYAYAVFAVTTVVLFFLCIVTNTALAGYTARDVGIIALMAVVSGIFGHTLYNWALRYLRASVISVSLLGEPLGSTLLAYVLPWIQEVPTVYTVAGGCFIIPGIYLTMRERELPV
jgi:drug/metabolite transporter (DMT)-like permease